MSSEVQFSYFHTADSAPSLQIEIPGNAMQWRYKTVPSLVGLGLRASTEEAKKFDVCFFCLFFSVLLLIDKVCAHDFAVSALE